MNLKDSRQPLRVIVFDVKDTITDEKEAGQFYGISFDDLLERKSSSLLPDQWFSNQKMGRRSVLMYTVEYINAKCK